MRRTPLPAKRATPRRKAPDRVDHQRTKPKAGARPTPAERAHMTRVREMPCLVPGCGRESTVHHVTASRHGGRIARSHKRVVPLCPKHHQIGHGPRESVEALGHGGFFEQYGIDLLAVADRLWKETSA